MHTGSAVFVYVYVCVCIAGGKVTDDVLGQLLSVGPGLKHVLAPGGFDLQSYEQGMLAWPWQSVTTEVMTTQTVLALPTPDPLGSKRTIRADVVVGISYEEVSRSQHTAHTSLQTHQRMDTYS